jgi:glycosyltransferase involved in cell wall biosynthesis
MSPAGDLARVRARFAAPGERLVLLVGRLVYEKGFHVALAALPRLIERAGPLRFVVADTGGLREVVPGRSRVGLRFRASDPRSLARMAERLLGDDALRARLVAEASEHVLRFDWADAARRTAALYAELRAARSSPVTTAPAGTSPRTTA